MIRGVADEVRPMSPIGPEHAYLIVGPKGTREKPIGVETLEPLAVGDIALSSGHVLHMTGVHELYLEPVLFEDLVRGNPVDPCRLHGNRGDATSFKPPRHGMEVGREAAKRSYWVLVPIRRHCNPMLFRADVDACGIIVDDRKRTALLGYTPFVFLPYRVIKDLPGLIWYVPAQVGLLQ